MQAIEFRPDGTAHVRELPVPQPGPGEAVVKVTSAGVCGSDISALHGTHPFRKPPLISGHEVGGTIAAIGPDGPDGFAVGDPVVVDPQWPCQDCALCARGDYHLCARKTMLGVASWPGGLADYVKVPAFTLVPAPAELDPALLSFAEPTAVAIHAVRKAGDLARYGSVLVLGGGTIGTLITAALSTEAPHLDLTVVEPREQLHELLGLAGAHTTVAGTDAVLPASYDLVFIAAGVPELVEASVVSAATGGTIVQVAVFGAPQPTRVGEMQIREITMIGTATYTKADIADALPVALAKRSLVDAMVTFTDTWDDAARQITSIAQDGPGDVMKLIVRRV